MAWDWHRPLEAKGVTFTVLTLLTVMVGGLVELVPPYFLQGTIDPIDGVKPYSALELEGRDLYIREGCNNCHSQMIRPFKAETDRYGPFTMPGEGIYDRPFLYGSRRTGPDLSRVGGKYPDSWHWIHLRNPREIEPRSIMPPYAFLIESPLDLSLTSASSKCCATSVTATTTRDPERRARTPAPRRSAWPPRCARTGRRFQRRRSAQRDDRADRVPPAARHRPPVAGGGGGCGSEGRADD